MATSSSNVTLKLLIDKKSRKVLFAEAGKEFVDFLFTLLSLPLGTVTKLLSKDNINMVGCLGNLYKSIEDLSDTFIQPHQTKDAVLNPKSAYSSNMNNSTLLLSASNNTGSAETRKFFKCPSSCQGYVADNSNALCPSCRHRMTRVLSFVEAAAADQNVEGNNTSEGGGGGGGFVRGVVTYMVMDNLEVRPMSTISSITLLNKFNIQKVGSLREKVITLGMAEGLKVLKASLTTNTVLSTVFL